MRRGAALGSAGVRLATVVGGAALLAVGLGSQPAGAHEGHTGAVGDRDAVGIAVAISRLAHPDDATAAADGGVDEVVLGRSDVFSDLLAAGSATGRPVLVTPTDRLAPRTAEELQRLGANRVTLLGGTQALSQDVAAALAQRGYRVDRVFGATRVETAVAIARRHHPRVGETPVIVARAGGDSTRAFADVLGGSALAHARAAPVVLTPGGELPDTVADYLTDAGAGRVIIAGGTDAVSGDVQRQIEGLGITVQRAAGSNRARTAIAQNRLRGLDVARDGGSVLLLNGYHPDAWVPGFAAGAWAARSDTAVALTTGERLDATTAGFLGGSAHTELVCGPTVADHTCHAAKRAMDLPPFAAVGGVVLRQLSTGVELIGFHQANHDGARQLQPRPTAPPSTTMDGRSRPTGSRSAADIVAHPHQPVRAPVTGTVIRAGTYRLYCDYSDDYAVIEPDARPGWEVKLLHIDGVQVEPGDRVHAGTTVLAPRPTRLPFRSQVEDYSAPRNWPHVHVEVIDPSIPDESSGSC